MKEDSGAVGRLIVSIASSVTVVILFFLASVGIVNTFWHDEDDDVNMGRVKLLFLGGAVFTVLLIFVPGMDIFNPHPMLTLAEYQRMPDKDPWGTLNILIALIFSGLYVLVGITAYVIGRKETK